MAWIDYDQHARSRPRDDLWGQVRRTVRGQPVGEEQIDLIVRTILEYLELSAGDTLLDLACGNGALSARLQPHCRASVGVDISPYLIDVATESFASADHSYLVGDGAGYAEAEPDPTRFTKALCYGSLSYFTDTEVARTLHALHARFANIATIMLGNLPDPARAAAFHTGPVATLHEPRSDIGVWRSAADLARLAGPDWRLEIATMPETFFAAHYRFDAVLRRSA